MCVCQQTDPAAAAGRAPRGAGDCGRKASLVGALGEGRGMLGWWDGTFGRSGGRRQSSARGSLFGSWLGLSLCPQKCLEARWRVWKEVPRVLLTSFSHPHEGWRPHRDMVRGLRSSSLCQRSRSGFRGMLVVAPREASL